MDPNPLPAKKVTASNIAFAIVFVVVIQLVALYITRVNLPAISQSGYSFAPAGTSSFGSASNAILLVLVVFATTVIALWLVRRRKVKIFKSVVLIGMSLALFLLTLLAADSALSSYLDETVAIYISFALAVVVVATLAASTFASRAATLGPAVTALLSAEVGSYFASTIPLLTALMLPIAFSAYDLYAVLKGPLKQLVTLTAEDSLGGVSSRVGEFTIGVGDTVFYSMLPSLALFQYSLNCALLTVAAVDAGVAVTLYLLGRAKLLPGLPIPMALGLASIFLCSFVF